MNYTFKSALENLDGKENKTAQTDAKTKFAGMLAVAEQRLSGISRRYDSMERVEANLQDMLSHASALSRQYSVAVDRALSYALANPILLTPTLPVVKMTEARSAFEDVKGAKAATQELASFVTARFDSVLFTEGMRLRQHIRASDFDELKEEVAALRKLFYVNKINPREYGVETEIFSILDKKSLIEKHGFVFKYVVEPEHSIHQHPEIRPTQIKPHLSESNFYESRKRLRRTQSW